MFLAATGGFNDIATWVTPLLIAVIGGYLVLVKGGVKTKTESRDKDLIILKGEMDRKIDNTKNEIDIRFLELMGELLAHSTRQDDFNDGFKKLMVEYQEDQKGITTRWDVFIDDQHKRDDLLSEKVQHTMQQVGEMKRDLGDMKKDAKKMIQRSVSDLRKAEEIYKTSGKSTQKD